VGKLVRDQEIRVPNPIIEYVEKVSPIIENEVDHFE
jgi:hypothetical protein